MLRPAFLTISSALVVNRWQWMSIVNHLPRACTGPGKRPGICAPSGRQVNSIASPPRVLSILPACRALREMMTAAGRTRPSSPYVADAAYWRGDDRQGDRDDPEMDRNGANGAGAGPSD